MLTSVVLRLRTGSVKNVVLFGSKTPTVPYVVVRAEAIPEIGARGVRVIAHFMPGDPKMENYVFSELSDLLKGYEGTDQSGNRFVLHDTGEWTEAAVQSDDETLSMERLFYVPMRTH